jgi:hypothetical protein
MYKHIPNNVKPRKLFRMLLVYGEFIVLLILIYEQLYWI